MAEQHRDKDQQNYLLDQARAIHDEIKVSVFGPSGAPLCAEAWSTAKLIAGLIHRIEALEAAAQPNPDSSLVERVALAITGDSDELINWKPEARAAICEVAAWLLEENPLLGGNSSAFASLLEQEAER